MPPDVHDCAAAEVLRRYPSDFFGELQPLGNRGGFSGARLWRVADLSLRAWPRDSTFPTRLTLIHQLMTQARASGLAFVPRLERTADLSSSVEHVGHWWELTEWLPGQADYRDHPTAARLEAACVAVAQLHQVWAHSVIEVGVCPAVVRRHLSLRMFHDALNNGWNPLQVATFNDPLRPLIERAARILWRWLASIPPWLAPWTEAHLPLQPCLCDVWHDHLLFEGDRLVGLIDYGSVKPDHVAVDLARLLGSLVEDNESGWNRGLAAYRSVRSLTVEEAVLARALDRTGVVLAVANWLRWLYAERRAFEDRTGVAGRLETLVTRIEGWGTRFI